VPEHFTTCSVSLRKTFVELRHTFLPGLRFCHNAKEEDYLHLGLVVEDISRGHFQVDFSILEDGSWKVVRAKESGDRSTSDGSSSAVIEKTGIQPPREIFSMREDGKKVGQGLEERDGLQDSYNSQHSLGSPDQDDGHAGSNLTAPDGLSWESMELIG
jgi:hypothetical protein